MRIRWRLSAPFPLDLLVRTPKEMAWRLKEDESFTTTIVTQGKVLYEKDHEGVGPKGRGRLPAGRASQTIANLAMTASRLVSGAAWDLEDAEALGAARMVIEQNAEIEAEVAEFAPAPDGGDM